MPKFKSLYTTFKKYLSEPLPKPLSNKPINDIAKVKERQIEELDRHESGYLMLAGLIAIVALYLFLDKPPGSLSFSEVLEVNYFTRLVSAALLFGFFFCFYRAGKCYIAIKHIHEAKLSTYPYEQNFLLPLRNRTMVNIKVAVEILESEKNEQNLARLMVGSNIALSRFLLDQDALPTPQTIDEVISKPFSEKYKELGLTFLRTTTVDVHYEKSKHNDSPVAII